MTQRQDDAGDAQGDALGTSGQEAKIDEGVVGLARIPERGHVEGHVAQPDGGESEFVGQLNPLEVTSHRRHGAGGVVLQRNHETEA